MLGATRLIPCAWMVPSEHLLSFGLQQFDADEALRIAGWRPPFLATEEHVQHQLNSCQHLHDFVLVM